MKITLNSRTYAEKRLRSYILFIIFTDMKACDVAVCWLTEQYSLGRQVGVEVL